MPGILALSPCAVACRFAFACLSRAIVQIAIVEQNLRPNQFWHRMKWHGKLNPERAILSAGTS
jgi:hypothetical protein